MKTQILSACLLGLSITSAFAADLPADLSTEDLSRLTPQFAGREPLEKLSTLPTTSAEVIAKLEMVLIYYRDEYMQRFEDNIKPVLFRKYTEKLSPNEPKESESEKSFDDYLSEQADRLRTPTLSPIEKHHLVCRKIDQARQKRFEYSFVYASACVQKLVQQYKEKESL
jgi:hypothetical protein